MSAIKPGVARVADFDRLAHIEFLEISNATVWRGHGVGDSGPHWVARSATLRKGARASRPLLP
jgi:hypothetical protein